MLGAQQALLASWHLEASATLPLLAGTGSSMEKSKSNYDTINAFGNMWALDPWQIQKHLSVNRCSVKFLQQCHLYVAELSEDITEQLCHLVLHG